MKSHTMSANHFLRAALLAGVGGAAAAVALLPQFALAQAGSDQNQNSGGVEEIIVTAQKRDQSAQNVPIAITALNNQQLQSAGVQSTLDLKAAVPALNITTGTGGIGLPRIRGIGATGQGPGIENPVAVYVDGVYYGASFGILQSMFDTDQVTVLKGPQGTLFGRNATGGLIQITTLGPSFDWTGKAEIGYGNYDTIHSAAYVSGGLTKTVAISLSGQYDNQQDGFGKNLYTGNDIQNGKSWGGRAKLLWQPSDQTKVLLSGDFNGRNSAAPAFRNFGLNALGIDVPTAIEALGGDVHRDILADIDPKMSTRAWGTSLTIEQDVGFATLKSITAYRHSKFSYNFDPDGTTMPRIIVDNHQFDKQFTQELNLISTEGGPFKWVLGGFYMHGNAGNDASRTTGLFTFGNNGYSQDDNTVKLDSFAGFAEGTYTFGESTNLTAGLRFTSDQRSLDATVTQFNGNVPPAGLTTVTQIPSESHTFNKLTWRLSLDHRFSPELLAYASYNRGFRGGTYITQSDPIVLLKPEQVDAFEVGIKSDLFGRKVRLNVAGYYYDEKNIQVMQVISGAQTVYNADAAEIYGIDADLTWRVTSNFRLFGGINWTHARYTDFDTAVISYPFPLAPGFVIPTGQSCLGTFGNPFAQLGGNCLLIGSATGNKLQNTPSFTASMGGSYDLETGMGKFTLAGNYYYNSGYVGSPDERVKQSSYNTVDASLTWRSLDDNLFVRLWGKNLTNAFYWGQIGATNSGDNGTYAAPRTYGVTAGFDF
ncbi:iron complex outermembrane receptor protein [Novosphingobium sp. PhB165]|uniref:TonB-dependent receptor n=1 Tax=Novosphingobium sp. PhB165 TaxID=2485105 RepID=UPI0010477951|nr:TonB-dependent receptor [Novosphingobium sp. PhB165]TCM19767.1 iron complex outermembrane receptor protein [Novosphingobium sp. PhB165]